MMRLTQLRRYHVRELSDRSPLAASPIRDVVCADYSAGGGSSRSIPLADMPNMLIARIHDIRTDG
jgi:hypothetical protein